jgi:6-methylsalicylate decarboxylase
MNRLRDDAPVVDVHQHVWPDTLIEALRARGTPPRMRGWTLELAGEPDHEVDPLAHDVDRRAALVRADGLDLALVSLSSPLGIESLPPGEAAELLDAYHEGALALPDPFGAWAAACLTEVDPAALARELERGFVGLQLPATSLLDAAGYETAGPLLEVLEEAGVPLMIHPGPAGAVAGAVAGGGPAGGVAGAVAGGGPAGGVAGAAAGGGPAGAVAGDDEPPWWPAMVSYVQQMHAAWFAFRVHGRPRHPRLRVCFAMLAGLAPLHSERFASRVGERGVVDQDVFLDVSSYGTRAVDSVVRVLGIDVLVNGSDRPYAEPVSLELGPAAAHAVRGANALRLLYPKEVFDDLAIASPA